MKRSYGVKATDAAGNLVARRSGMNYEAVPTWLRAFERLYPHCKVESLDFAAHGPDVAPMPTKTEPTRLAADDPAVQKPYWRVDPLRRK